MLVVIFIGTSQRKNGQWTDLGVDQRILHFPPTFTEYQGVEIFLRVSWYNLKVLSPSKLLVEKSVLPTG